MWKNKIIKYRHKKRIYNQEKRNIKNMNLYNQKTKNLPDLQSQDLEQYFKNIQTAKDQIVSDLKNNQIAPINIAFEVDDLQEINNLAMKINQDFKKIVILGVGGSSLGGKTLTAIDKNFADKIVFLESIDSCSIADSLAKITRDADLREVLFLVISKSGQTIETTCQTLIMIDQFKQNNITHFAKNFIFITQDKTNNIAQIALEIGSKIYSHPSNIGGRFSYLSIVGLLPAAICGLDIFKIRNGAKRILEDFINEDIKKNDIAKITAYQLYMLDKGFNNNVIMPYIDSLRDFTDWYRQLWAESLGKNGFGSTPINSMGTVDQHSQLQLYLDGPKDKFFTFITNKKPSGDFVVKDLPNCPTLFGGKNLNEIVKVEQDSTIEILNQKNLPIRILEIENLNEETLSALMMQMFLETVIIAYAKEINPFDQPAVELRKILAKEYLQK
ncbi:MAG: glucose-6-phosphate isomerase [Rickettsiales bacterium]|jgi:glucose-6-phosphate isomerase